MSLEKTDAIVPVTKKTPTTYSFFSDNRIDNYAWLSDTSDPLVVEEIRLENAYTDQVMAQNSTLQKSLYHEMLQHVSLDESIFLFEGGGYHYYRKSYKEKPYPVFYRRKEDQEDVEILLDINKIAKDSHYKRLGCFKVSPNHQMLSYSIDITGDETYTLFIKNLISNTIEIIHGVSDSLEWANNSKSVYYLVNDAGWVNKLCKHIVGSSVKQEVLYIEEDKAFSLWLNKSKDKRFIFLYSNSNNTVESYAIKADSSEGSVRLIFPRETNVEYYLEASKNDFLVLSNKNAPNFEVFKLSQSDLQRGDTLIPHRQDVVIEDLDVFEHYVAVYERVDERPLLCILHLDTRKLRCVDLPDMLYALKKKSRNSYNTNHLYFYYQSYLTPRSLMELDMRTMRLSVKQQQFMREDYDPKDYLAYQVFVKPARDDVLIPLTLIHKNGIVPGGENPLWLTAYGAYGLNIEPFFSAERLLLLERGVVFAIAHVRGGSDCGVEWYNQGKGLNKKNSINDFIACANYLIDEEWTSSKNLIIEGASAGGLLIAAVLNRVPEICKIAILKAPFVDVLNMMLDDQNPDVCSEYEEWGDPHHQDVYAYIKSYCPYENIREDDYPHMLVTTSLTDVRVPPGGVLKWVKKLRELKTDDNFLLLKVDELGGHADTDNKVAHLERIAFKYAFVMDQLGIRLH